MQASEKIMQVISLCELTLKWINSGHQHVQLFIRSSKFFLFHFHTQVTKIFLCCGDKEIYDDFFVFLLEHG